MKAIPRRWPSPLRRFHGHDIDPNELFQAFFGQQAGGFGGGGVRFQFGGNGFQSFSTGGDLFGNARRQQRHVKPAELKQAVYCTLEDMCMGKTMRHRTVHSTLIQSPFGLQQGQKYQDSTIQIKRGCKDETVVTIEGKGENVGNAVCVIRPREHPRFTREDNDLISEQILPISRFFTKGVYKLRIKTITGESRVLSCDLTGLSTFQLIYPGTEEAMIGAGMPIENTTESGDLIVKIGLIFPSTLRKMKRLSIKALRALLYLFCAWMFFTGGNIFVIMWMVWCFNRMTAGWNEN